MFNISRSLAQDKVVCSMNLKSELTWFRSALKELCNKNGSVGNYFVTHIRWHISYVTWAARSPLRRKPYEYEVGMGSGNPIVTDNTSPNTAWVPSRTVWLDSQGKHMTSRFEWEAATE